MINKVILVGNVGANPEIKHLPSGGSVANFSLATSESWKDETGARKDRTEWHRLVVFSSGLVQIIEKYIKKGSKLYIEGSIRSRKHMDRNGIERFTTEIIVRNFADTIKILDSRCHNESFAPQGQDATSETENSKTPSSDLDDDIPF